MVHPLPIYFLPPLPLFTAKTIQLKKTFQLQISSKILYQSPDYEVKSDCLNKNVKKVFQP
jgi:hypothetical protein